MNVLAIGAHYDDVELGAGGSVARHIKDGDNVYMLVVTHSGYTSSSGEVIRDKKTALQEGLNAANVLGINDDKFLSLNYETKNVSYGVELIEKIDFIINKHKIDLVYTHWVGDVHQDHSVIAKATLNAARHVPKILMYRSNWYKSKEVFNGNFFVDITDFIDVKIKALEEHASECSRRGSGWVTFVRNQNRTSGIEMGVQYAEAFELIKWLA